jgi:8-oxo-dGTP pyrophosphatase MutT (NUDIX family)
MNRFFGETLKKALSTDLPGIGSHLIMIPPGRQTEPAPELQDTVKQSAVLVVLFFSGVELNCLLIKRPPTMKFHPGQVAFPGGTAESNDRNLQETALREAQEEIGISPDSVEIVGELSKVYVSVSNFLIHPFVAWAGTEPPVSINAYETEKIIRFPIGRFMMPEHITSKPIQTSNGLLNVPCLLFDDEIIWGATAMILLELIDVLKQIRE